MNHFLPENYVIFSHKVLNRLNITSEEPSNNLKKIMLKRIIKLNFISLSLSYLPPKIWPSYKRLHYIHGLFHRGRVGRFSCQ